MKLHPSGLTYERWDWPFKTSQELEAVRRYLHPDLMFNDTNPF